MRFDPAQQLPIDVVGLLPDDVLHDGTTLSGRHQIPHRGDRRLAPSLVRDLGLIGNEMELAAAVKETALLDLVSAHGDSCERKMHLER
jgi:hypothetical protein